MTSSIPAVVAPRRAIIAGHGDFAVGMVSAVQQISGNGDTFHAVSSRDLSAVAIEQLLRATIDAHDVQVIFTDLPAGSCTIAARRVARDVPGVAVVTGTNLSVLLSWALGTDDSVEAWSHTIERGRSAMVVFPPAAPGDLREGGGGH
jgi:PTS system N-acetylgalactosamine-specific IIA component